MGWSGGRFRDFSKMLLVNISWAFQTLNRAANNTVPILIVDDCDLRWGFRGDSAVTVL